MFNLKKSKIKLDFVAIGDIVVDNFIQLNKKEAEIFKDEKSGIEKLCINFADKIPYESSKEISAVGNSPNAAVAAARLGLKSALIADVGDDENGKKCLNSLKKNSVVTNFIKKHKGEQTNYHYVLRYNADRTILVKHTEFNYKFPNIGSPKWIYLSSLAENSLPYHKEIFKYLESRPETKLAFQPGTFQMNLGYENLKNIYQRTDLFFCNKEEALRILKPLNNDVQKIEIVTLLKMMRELGPKIIVITDGPNGAYVFDGNKTLHAPMYPDINKPVDRTGAGDSFSSTFTSALALGKTLEEALLWAPINSMSVVQYVGAQEGLLSKEQLEKYLLNSPLNYKVKKIK